VASKVKAKKKTYPISRPENLSEEANRLFDRIAEEMIHGDRELFDTLSTHEKKTVIDWLSDAIVTGPANAVHDLFWEVDYVRKPVGIDEFLENDEYMGRVCSDLHPRWREDMRIVLGPGSKVAEWIMTGGIGIGKTTIAMSAIAYKIYCLSCLKSPARYYGLLHDSLIVFGIYSITKRQVADAGYFKLRGFIDTCPYFRLHYPRSRKIDSKVVFPEKNVNVIPGSQELHALGLDLFSFAMDEVNFMRVKNDKEGGKATGQAYDLYNAVHARILSRFMRPGGTIPGLMLLMSSRNAQTSFLEEHLKKVKGSASSYVSDYPLWECKPKHRFQLPKFNVEVGDRIARSRILGEGDNPRKGARVVTVPGEFKQTFLEDIDQALRDIAGVATFNVSPLIRDRQSIFDASRAEMQHPFTKPVVTLDVLDDTLLDEYFMTKLVCKVESSIYKPRLNPGCPRFMHIDIGLRGDCAGIAMSHISGMKVNQRVNPDGTLSTVRNPFAVVDFMLRIVPPPGSEIDLSKLRAFVLFIKRLYPLVQVTFDGFQSADSVQILKKQEIDACLLSVDRTDVPYLSLRSAFFDRRIACYEYTPFIDEMLDLERDATSGKVDHPARATNGGKGSKDVADAVCGSVYMALTDERSKSQTLPVIGEDQMLPVKAIDPADTATMTITRPDPTNPEVTEIVPASNVRLIGGKAVNWDVLQANVDA